MSIAENVRLVRERIRGAAERCGRLEREITLIAVAKTHPAQAVDEIVRCGVTDIGENRIQEAVKKYADVREKAVWHMVGHLQRNKAKAALAIFSVIHSLDSLELADILDKNTQKPLDVFIEVTSVRKRQNRGFRRTKHWHFCRRCGIFRTSTVGG